MSQICPFFTFYHDPIIFVHMYCLGHTCRFCSFYLIEVVPYLNVLCSVHRRLRHRVLSAFQNNCYYLSVPDTSLDVALNTLCFFVYFVHCIVQVFPLVKHGHHSQYICFIWRQLLKCDVIASKCSSVSKTHCKTCLRSGHQQSINQTAHHTINGDLGFVSWRFVSLHDRTCAIWTPRLLC